MEEKIFMHRIQEENGVFSKGIEVHDTLDDAVRAFHGRMKLAYNNPSASGLTFMSCWITDGSGAIIRPYADTWAKNMTDNKFFMHHIRRDGDTYTKEVDICADFDTAKRGFHAEMEYGYGNTRFPNVTFVSCMITDKAGAVLDPYNETWNKPEPEPEE